MDKFQIIGNRALGGEVTISGAKNSAVAIIPAVILSNSPCILENIPDISDVRAMFSILAKMGATITKVDDTTYVVDATKIEQTDALFPEVREMRASYYLLGVLLAHKKEVSVLMPGGCEFGERPIDLHLKGFQSLGATYEISNDEEPVISVSAKELKGSPIYMDVVSVGATINVMLAAVKAEGVTTIENAAREPHIVDLANFLNMMGARIRGAGTNTIRITGVSELHGVRYSIIPDQIEAGTYMAAIAATHGRAVVKNIIPQHLDSIISKFVEMGITVQVNEDSDSVLIDARKDFCACNIVTAPHPGFPTDMQPQFVVLLAMAKGMAGKGFIYENVWSDRFQYVKQLQEAGMKVSVKNVKTQNTFLLVQESSQLRPYQFQATDLRAGAAMVIAALCIDGESIISNTKLIERGYDHIIEKLKALGAEIERI